MSSPPQGVGLSSLVPYVPRLALEWDQRFGATRSCELSGSMVFIDLSGFTALSERLARLGREGAEQVTLVIDDTFTDLLAAAYAAGGTLLKFGGDALLLFFEGNDHAPRASRAAYDMRARLRARGSMVTPAGKATLRMSVGVHSGTFNFFLVGDSHRELIVTGPGASATATMESAASAGQIVISPSTAAALPAKACGRALGPGRLLSVPPEVAPQQIVAVDLTTDVSQFIPQALREVVSAGATDAEHRSVAVAFLHFDGTDDLLTARGPEVVAEGLEQLLRNAQAALTEHNLCFLSSDLDKNGGKLIFTGGVPNAHEDDEDRLVRAVRRIVDETDAISVRVGLNRGSVFAGAVGPAYRRTYTIMGDTVNTAARVMAHASGGQILATPAFLARVAAPFEQTAVEPFAAKGKAKPLEASLIGQVLSQPRVGLPTPTGTMHGRTELLTRLLHAARAADEGSGAALTLLGPAGAGKTRLLSELVARFDSDAAVEVVRGDRFASAISYGALRPLLRSALGVDRAADDPMVRAALSAAPPEDRPFLARALAVDPPNDTPLPELRENLLFLRTRSAVADAIRPTTPTVWLIEDSQHLDADSLACLRTIAGTIGANAHLLVASARTGATPIGEAIEVPPLDEVDAEQLVIGLSRGRVERADVRQIVARAGGSPLVLEALTVAVADGGSLDDLPDSIETLASAAIDSLAPTLRTQLRSLAVLGQHFSAELASVVLGGIDPDWTDLDPFIVRADAAFHFRQGVHRDAAYQGLPYRTRREKHLIVARHLASSDGSSFHAALHFHQANAWDQTWSTARYEANAAVDRTSFREAAALFRWAAEAGDQLADVEPGLRAEVWFEAANRASLVGNRGDAEHAVEKAWTLVDRASPTAVKVCHLQCMLKKDSGKLASAVRWARRGLRIAERFPDDPETVKQANRILNELARIDIDRGQFVAARKKLLEVVADAERRDDGPGVAHASNWLVPTLSTLGDPAAAEYGARAIAGFQAAKADWMIGYVVNNLGNAARASGDFHRAVDHFRDALTRIGALSDEHTVAITANNMGELLADQGHFDDALTHLESAHATFSAANHIYAAVVGYNIARVLLCRGDHDAAEARLADSVQSLTEARLDAYADEPRLRMAESKLLRGEPAAAQAILEDVRPSVNTTKVLHLRLQGMAAAGQGDDPGPSLRASLKIARENSMPFAQACTLAAIAHFCGDLASAEQATALFDRLGVVRPPPLPKAASESFALDKSDISTNY
ncbi:MAG: adenylate/guanylate cyclase domain-containing protein [Acidimicrobiales bacterium]